MMPQSTRAVRTEFLPLSRPTIGEEEIQEVVDTLRSGWITTGPKVELFEKRFKDYLGMPEAVCRIFRNGRTPSGAASCGDRSRR